MPKESRFDLPPSPDSTAAKNSKEGTLKVSVADTALCKEFREVYDRLQRRWAPLHKQRDLDMQALSVDGPWPEEERKARDSKINPRPCEHFDIIGQNNARVINQFRMNKRGYKVTPIGDGANDKTAEMRENRMRQIEYDAHAIRARITAFTNAVDGGFGFYEIGREFQNPFSFHQKITVSPIPNPAACLPDIFNCVEADFSDMPLSIKLDRMTHADFVREYPRATFKGFSKDEKYPSVWIDEKTVMVAEVSRIEKTPEQLINFGSKPMLEGDIRKRYPDYTRDENSIVLTPGSTRLPIIEERESERSTVMQYTTNGIEILKRRPWVGSIIPLIIYTGRIKYEDDGEMVMESLTRKQRAPQMLYDYAATSEIETLGFVPKSKWVIADGQLEGFEDEWANAHKSIKPYLRYKPQTDATGQALLPPPQRTDFEPPIQAFQLSKQGAQQAAQNAAGMVSAERKDRESKSGVAQDRMDTAADIASYHFNDSAALGTEKEGRIINEILDKIDDSERQVGLRKADDSYEMQQISPTQDEAGNVLSHPYGDGDQHGVTIGDAPDVQSQREAASDTANKLLENPEAFQRIAWLAIKMLNLGPLGDQMSELLEPPDVAAKKNGGPQIPPQIQQAIQQLQQQHQVLMQANQQLLQERQSKQVETDGKVEIVKLQTNMQIAIQQMKDATAIAVAGIQQKGQLLQTHEELSSEENLAMASQRHDIATAQQAQQAAAAQSSQDAGEAADASAQGHEQATAQQDQSAQAALAQQAQAAKLAPQPDNSQGGQ